MAHFEKHFTLEEANALLPQVRELLERLQATRSHLSLHWEAAKPVLRAARTNGGGKEAAPYLSDLHQLNDRLRRLAELGVQLKDLEKGLVDFPAWRDGEEVFLCWHLGEDRVAYWHETRDRLCRPEEVVREMPFASVPERVAFRPDRMNKVNLFEVPELFLDVYCLEPGQAQKPHAHGDAAKVYYVIEGEGTFLVGTEERTLGPGNAVLAPAGDPHGVRNDGSSRLTLLVMMAPNPNASEK